MAQLNATEFVSAGADGMLVKWNIKNPGEGLLIANAEEPIYNILVHNHKIIMGLKSGKIFIYDWHEAKKGQVLEFNQGAIFSQCSCEEYIFLGTGNGSIIRLNNEFDVINDTKLGNKAIRSMHISGDNLLAGATGGMLYSLKLNLNLTLQIDSQQDSIFSISQNSMHILTAGKDGSIKIWNKDISIARESIKAHLHQVKHLRYNHKNSIVASFSMDKSIRLWDANSLDLIKVISFEKHQTHTSSINCGLWFNQNTLISCSDDRKIFAFKLNLNPT